MRANDQLEATAGDGGGPWSGTRFSAVATPTSAVGGYAISPYDRLRRDCGDSVGVEADDVQPVSPLAVKPVPDVSGRDISAQVAQMVVDRDEDYETLRSQFGRWYGLRQKKGYLAGPMTGIDHYNYPAFREATKRMEVVGLRVVNPADLDPPGHTPGEWSHDRYLRRDLREVIDADYLVVLDGWRESKGARTEVAVARGLGLPVFSYPTFERVEFSDRIDGPSESRVAGQFDAMHGLMDEMDEVRVTNEKTGGQKGRKPARFDLLPGGALEAIATHFGIGAAKYDDRNWERGYDWSLSFAALQRHLWAFWQGEDYDLETGSSHLAAAGFHILVLLTFAEKHGDLDDRPT